MSHQRARSALLDHVVAVAAGRADLAHEGLDRGESRVVGQGRIPSFFLVQEPFDRLGLTRFVQPFIRIHGHWDDGPVQTHPAAQQCDGDRQVSFSKRRGIIEKCISKRRVAEDSFLAVLCLISSQSSIVIDICTPSQQQVDEARDDWAACDETTHSASAE